MGKPSVQSKGLKHAAARPVDTTEMNWDFNALFENVFICADRNRPSMNFPAMCDADRRKCAKILDRYNNKKMCTEFQELISNVLREELLERLWKSPFVGFVIDESVSDVDTTLLC